MAVTGLGLGLTMQVLVLAVQNSVQPKALGTATSAATFFRSIGGSIGVSVFSAIFNNKMSGNLAHQLPQLAANPSLARELRASPQALATLPAPVHDGYLRAFTESLHVVFLAAIPVALLAFALTWLLTEVPLRTSVAPIDGVSAGFGMLRAAAVQVQQEGLARVAAAKAALGRLGELGLPADQTATLSEIFTARVSYLEQIARERPEPEQATAKGWEIAVEVLRTERAFLIDAAKSVGGTARGELEIRHGAAQVALARLDELAATASAEEVGALTSLREAYTGRLERLRSIATGAAQRDDLTPDFWQAAALLLTVERETLAVWQADAELDAATAERTERDLAVEAADLAVSAAQ
jgi:hypothetical protein